MPGLIFLSIKEIMYIQRRLKSGIILVLNPIDNEKVFKPINKRDKCIDFCNYKAIDPQGITRYYGRGKYYFGRTPEYNVKHMRATNHKNDLFSDLVTEGWIIEICTIGVTYEQSCAYEAKMIMEDGKPLSKLNIRHYLDPNCLINKRRERKWECKIEEYIYGNYTGIAA